MQPFREKVAEKTVSDLPFVLTKNPQIGLALATVPFLGLLIVGHTLSYWLIQFGMASEEMFRGIQLPNLNPGPHRPL